MSLKGIVNNLHKGETTITKYMQLIKMCNDELLLMNAACDIDKLTLKILRGLSDEYSSLAFTVKARETLVFFDKLHEKLITYEAQLKQDQDKKLLTGASAYLAIKNPNTSSHHNYKANSYRCNVSSNNRHLPASPHQTHPPTSQTLPGFLLALWYSRPLCQTMFYLQTYTLDCPFVPTYSIDNFPGSFCLPGYSFH